MTKDFKNCLIYSAFWMCTVACTTRKGAINESKKQPAMNETIKQAMGNTGPIMTAGSTVRLIANHFKFTEGPAVDKNGNVYFTDQPNDKIWKYDTNGELSVFMDKTGRANGLYFDNEGNLLACADEKNELWRIGPGKAVTVLVKDWEGKKLNGPNDVWAHPQGGIYFTDPYYQRPYWEHKKPEIEGQKVYFLPKNEKALRVADDKLVQPNGIIGTPDGAFLYVADIGANKTYRYRIAANGALTDRQLFAPQGSDGMTIDNRGNVYLTGNGVTVYNAAGEKIQHIPVPAKWTANICFAGKAKNKIFITASEGIYEMDMLVQGVQ